MVKIKKFLKIFFLILIISIFLFLIVNVYIVKRHLNKVFWIKEYGVLVESSNIMEPEFLQNELIVIKRCNEYDLDDLIVYTNFNNEVLIRRIVQIDEYSFIAKADNNKFAEPNEKIEAINGKVVYHSSKLGWIFK